MNLTIEKKKKMKSGNVVKRSWTKRSPFTLRTKDASCCEGLTVTAYLSSIHVAFHSTQESQNDLATAT